MKIHIPRSIDWLILLAVAASPLFTIGEVFALFAGLVESQVIVYTPVYLKAAKDVLLIAITLLAVLGALRAGRTNGFAVPLLLLAIYVVAVALPALALDARLPLAGVRWVLPFFLALLLIPYASDALLGRLARVLGILLIVHALMQVAQLFFMSPWYGTVAFGLAARVPGIFFLPSTAAFFSLSALYFALFHTRESLLRSAVFVAAPISVLMTQSGSGIVVLFLFGALLLAGPRLSLLAAPLVPPLLVGLLALLPVLTGRGEDYVQESGGTRVEIFVDMVMRGEWLPSAFGFATNTAVSWAENISGTGTLAETPQIVDSTYGSIIGNLGLFGGILFLVVAAGWVVVLLIHQRTELLAFTLIFGLFGATTVVTEAFPMSLLFALLLARHLRVYVLERKPVRQEPGRFAKVPLERIPGLA